MFACAADAMLTSETQGCNFPWSNVALFAELLGYASSFATIGYQLSKAKLQDSLFIKTELKFCAIFASVAALPWFVTVRASASRR